MLQCAAIQLNAISSTSSLVEICLNISLPMNKSEDKDVCGSIDSALSSGKFPLLCRVKLKEEIPFKWFPNLQRRGILEVIVQRRAIWEP